VRDVTANVHLVRVKLVVSSQILAYLFLNWTLIWFRVPLL
jgi:hypothetical protein